MLVAAWNLMGNIPAHEITQPLSFLNARSFQLKETFHEGFNNVWSKLVFFDKENGVVTINENIRKHLLLKRSISYDANTRKMAVRISLKQYL
jgi:hypothetical protein